MIVIFRFLEVSGIEVVMILKIFYDLYIDLCSYL